MSLDWHVSVKVYLVHGAFRVTNLHEPQGAGAVSCLISCGHHRGLQEALLCIILQCTSKTPVATFRLGARLYVQIHCGCRTVLAQSCTHTWTINSRPAGTKIDSINQSNQQKLLPQPTDSPLLFERIVLELSTFSAKKTNLLDQRLLATVFFTWVWSWLLTHYYDGVPTPAREIRHVMERAKDGPWHGGANLGTESLISRHPEASVSRVPPCKDLIVCE